MWPSEETASRLYDLANWGLITGLVVGVVSTIFVVWMGNTKESYLQGRLADTNAIAASANERAAEAGKGTAEALVEQERIRLENLTLQSRLASLQKQSEPRRLTGEQRASLTKRLASIKDGLTIVSPMADGEASDFADDFNSAVQSAGWQTLRIANRISIKFGLSVVTVDGTALPQTQRLSDALTAIGLPHDVTTVKNGDASTSPAFQAGFLYLVVEHKPLPTTRPK
jgi:hypothetical protein